MKRIVLDASAVMAFFENQPGAEKVHDLIHLGIEGERQLLMSVVNWGEAYYSTWRTKGPGAAQHFLDEFAQLPIQLIPADAELARTAAEFKANLNLPYVDGFAAALALQRKASLATSDKDFSRIQKKLDILWTT